jgi:hypothetical protein
MPSKKGCDRKRLRIERILNGSGSRKGFIGIGLTKCINKVALKFQKLRVMQCADDNGWCKCMSCGAKGMFNSRNMHGGHFLSRRHKSVILTPDNCWAQCAKCNVFLGGAHLDYEFNLRGIIGADRIEELKNQARTIKNWTKHELAELMFEIEEDLKRENERIRPENQKPLFGG